MRPRGVKKGGDAGKLAEALKELLDFLEICVHQVLHARSIYPQAIFDRRRKYGLPVFMSRHPDLNLYVREVLDAAAPMLQEGSIDQLVLAVAGPGGEPLESFAFQIPDPPALLLQLAALPPPTNPHPANPSGAMATTAGGTGAVNLPRAASDPYPMFRRVLLRLAVCDQQAELGAVPEDATFALLFSTRAPHARPASSSSSSGGGGRGAGAVGGQQAPNAWAAAVASGEFTLSSQPTECYLTYNNATVQQQQGQQAAEAVGQMNIVNWTRDGAGGGAGGTKELMSVWLRSKLVLGSGGGGGREEQELQQQPGGGGGEGLEDGGVLDEEDEFM